MHIAAECTSNEMCFRLLEENGHKLSRGTMRPRVNLVGRSKQMVGQLCQKGCGRKVYVKDTLSAMELLQLASAVKFPTHAAQNSVLRSM